MSRSSHQYAGINGDTNNTTDEEWSPQPRIAGLDAVNTIIACLAVFGNCVVITVMLLRRRVFSSATNHLILHQSVIDSIAGVLFFLHKVVKDPSISISTEVSFYNEVTCRFLYSDFLLWSVDVTSTYNLVIISLERFMATCYPVKHRNICSKAKLKLAVVTTWAIGFIYCLHIPLVIEPVPQQGRCRVVNMAIGFQVFLGLVVVGTEYFVPISLMIYAYTRILKMLTTKTRNRENGQQNTLNKAKKNVLVTILLAVIMFVICWTPTELDYIDELFFDKSWGYTVSVALTGLLACNMFVNPIIYCFIYDKFRAELKDLALKRMRGNRVHNEEQS